MKKIIAFLLAISLVLCGCGNNNNTNTDASNDYTAVNSSKSLKNSEITKEETGGKDTELDTNNLSSQNNVSEHISIPKIDGSEYAKSLSFDGLEDEDLQRFVKDNIYSELLTEIDNEEYVIENVDTVYISKEYIEELEYNSKVNVFFGYTLAELEQQFQGQKYVFTIKDGETVAVPFEGYDDTFNKVLKNVAIGAGVILICVTVSAVTAGAGAPAVSMIFAASAKTATTMAVSSGLISGVAAGMVEGVKTGDMNKALKAGALAGSEGFMWGAITGAITGGASETIALKGATTNGLTMNEVATIQKESGYPLDVIKGFKNMEQYNIVKEGGLYSTMVDGKLTLIRDIDLNYLDPESGLTNLERMAKGLAPKDPTGVSYELHHIGQKADSTLAILSKSEHMQGGNDLIWHDKNIVSEAHGAANPTWDKQRQDFWKSLAKIYNQIIG